MEVQFRISSYWFEIAKGSFSDLFFRFSCEGLIEELYLTLKKFKYMEEYSDDFRSILLTKPTTSIT